MLCVLYLKMSMHSISVMALNLRTNENERLCRVKPGPLSTDIVVSWISAFEATWWIQMLKKITVILCIRGSFACILKIRREKSVFLKHAILDIKNFTDFVFAFQLQILQLFTIFIFKILLANSSMSLAMLFWELLPATKVHY